MALLGLVVIILSMIDVSSLLTLKITLHSTLSDKGVFIKYGFTRRVDDFLPFDEIQNMRIKQSWLGKKLGYGSVILLGKRFGVSIQYIEYPEKYLQEIQSSLLASTNTRSTPHAQPVESVTPSGTNRDHTKPPR